MRPEEREAVVTTIVGGRPPGCGCAVGNIPRGVEVLIKKASVDPEFRTTLLARRGAAAEAIGLELTPAEQAMIGAITVGQLEQIIQQTEVPEASRRAFLGTVAAAMLAALGAGTGCDHHPVGRTRGVQPDRIRRMETGDGPTTPTEPLSRGIRPDRPKQQSGLNQPTTQSMAQPGPTPEEMVPHTIETPRPLFTAGHDANTRSSLEEYLKRQK